MLTGCEPLSKEGDAVGVLVLHGFTGCPQSMRPLAEAFAAAGHGVEMPLLPGHGTTVEDMLTTTWTDWSTAAEAALATLAERSERVAVAGLSMGGTLTAWLATRHPELLGIVLVNPAVSFPDDMVTLLQQMVDSGEETIPAIGGDIADPDAPAEAAYDKTPLRPLLSLAAATAELQANLDQIACPVLLLNSPQDHVITPGDSDKVAAGVAGPVERVTLERSFHVATLDHDRELICREAVAFVQRMAAS